MKYTEDTLTTWTAPLSKTEEDKVGNMISMIRDAINHSEKLKPLDIEIFAQGSYANNTNVRSDSDVDICIMLKSTFFTEYPENKTRNDYGFSEGSISFEDYKQYVKAALTSKFGTADVKEGNKSIKISSNSYRVQADVVPALMLKNYALINSLNPEIYVEGIRFPAKDGTQVTNYPKDHKKNGTQKNNATGYIYKKLVRIMKHIKNNMDDEKIIDGDIISSFLVECLVWNVPNDTITKQDSWNGRIIDAIAYLYKAIDDNQHNEWGEVSEHLYLFSKNRKWTDADAKNFLLKAWNYLEYNK